MIYVLDHFRGITAATLDLSGVVIAAGRNGAGKTSLALGLQALVAEGCLQPLTGRKGQDNTLLVRRGAKRARARISDGKGATKTALWPPGELKIEAEVGATFHADGNVEHRGATYTDRTISAIAAGVVRFGHLSLEERADGFARAANAFPSAGDFQAACERRGIIIWQDPWAVAARDGLDAGAAWCRTQATECKGRWCEVTGSKRWSDKAAAAWCPPAVKGLEAEDMPRIEAEVASAEALKARAFAKVALSAEVLRKLAEDADRAPADEMAETKAAQGVRACEDSLREIRDDLATMGVSVPCPYCKGDLEIVDLTVEKASHGGRVVTRAQLLDTRSRLQVREATLRARQQELAQAAARSQASRAAVVRLKEVRDRLGPEEAPIDFAEAERQLAAATARLEGLKAHLKASNLARLVGWYGEMAELLGPTGLRKERFAQALEAANARLLSISDPLKIGPVALAADLEVSIGPTPYVALSQSERWMADTAVQLLVAEMEGAWLVVIDGADVLDTPRRNGLIGALRNSGVPNALILITIGKREKVPNLAKAKLGRSYWIDGGTAEEIA